MTVFNPFSKPLGEVAYQDLTELSDNEVAEGFYIEYKSEMPSNKKIAKSISSFANTEGGLFFVGIEDNNTNIPVSFPGIELNEDVEVKEKIRNVIKGRINPAPEFKTRVLKDPSSMQTERAATLTSVAKSPSTPHITNRGRIYRRLGEGSDPYRYETEPQVVDRLVDRRREWHNQMAEFCQSGLGFTEGQDDWSFVELYGILSTLGNAVCTDVLDDVEGFRDQLASTQVTYSSEEDDSTEQFEYDLTMGQNLDICRSTSEGIVAHSLNVTREGAIDPAHTPLTLTFYIDGGK